MARGVSHLDQRVKNIESELDVVKFGANYSFPTPPAGSAVAGLQVPYLCATLLTGGDISQIATDEGTSNFTIKTAWTRLHLENTTTQNQQFSLWRMVSRDDSTSDPAADYINESKTMVTPHADTTKQLFMTPWDVPGFCRYWKILWHKRYSLLPGRFKEYYLRSKSRHYERASPNFKKGVTQAYMLIVEPPLIETNGNLPLMSNTVTKMNMGVLQAYEYRLYRVIPKDPTVATNDLFDHTGFSVPQEGTLTHVNPTSGAVEVFASADAGAAPTTGYAGVVLASEAGQPSNEAP